MNIPTIETERLRLRAFAADDRESYAEMYSDESFVRYLSGTPLSKEQTWENMAIVLDHWALIGYGVWAEAMSAAKHIYKRRLADLVTLPAERDL